MKLDETMETVQHWKVTPHTRLEGLLVHEELEGDYVGVPGGNFKKKKSQPNRSLTREEFLELRRNRVDVNCAKFPIFEENNACMLVRSPLPLFISNLNFNMTGRCNNCVCKKFLYVTGRNGFEDCNLM